MGFFRSWLCPGAVLLLQLPKPVVSYCICFCRFLWAFSRLALRVAVATLAQLNVHYNIYFTHTPIDSHRRSVFRPKSKTL